MGASQVLTTAFQPLLGFSATQHLKNSKRATAATFASPQQRVLASVNSNVIEKGSEFRCKAKNVPKQITINLSVSQESRESAMLDIQNASELEPALLRSGEILKTEDLNVLLRHFWEQNRWKDVCQLFDWMQQHGKINAASYSSYIKFVGRDSNPMKALEIYNSIKDWGTRKHASVCNSTLNCLIRSGKFDSSLKLFNRMKQSGLVPDIVTYSTLLVGCTKVKGGYSKAMDLVREIKSKGLSMDVVLYGTLISVCASNNQCEEAEKYFNEMKNEGHSPNVFHYSSLLNAYAINGNYKKADELIKEMSSAGIVMNKVVLTTLLKVYVKGHLFEKSRELLDELQVLGYAEDEIPYCLLMDGLAKSDNVTEAKAIFDEMKQRQVKNDGYSYSIMITAFCRSGLIEEANQLASEYENKYDKYDVVILNSMLCAYCRTGDMDNVMKLMKKMDESAISPDRNTFHILIKYFCKEKLYLLAYRTMEDMHRKGHEPEENRCAILIHHLGKVGAHAEAFSVYNMLKYSKRTIRTTLHGTILHILLSGGLLKEAYVVVKVHAKLIPQSAIREFASCFMKDGNINLVNDVIKSLHSSGCKVDKAIFFTAISRYVEQPKKKELLLHLLQWMPGQGYHIDLPARKLILENSHLFEQHALLALLSEHSMVVKKNKSQEGKTK